MKQNDMIKNILIGIQGGCNGDGNMLNIRIIWLSEDRVIGLR